MVRCINVSIGKEGWPEVGEDDAGGGVLCLAVFPEDTFTYCGLGKEVKDGSAKRCGWIVLRW